MRPRHSRNDHRQALEVSIERQRQFGHHLRLEDAARVRSVGLKGGTLRGDRDLFGHLSDAQRQIDADCRVHVHLDALAGHLLESLELGIHRVVAVGKAVEDVVTGFVGDRGAADVPVDVGSRHRRTRNGRSARIGDIAEQGSGDRLCRSGRRNKQKYRAQGERAEYWSQTAFGRHTQTASHQNNPPEKQKHKDTGHGRCPAAPGMVIPKCTGCAGMIASGFAVRSSRFATRSARVETVLKAENRSESAART